MGSKHIGFTSLTF